MRPVPFLRHAHAIHWCKWQAHFSLPLTTPPCVLRLRLTKCHLTINTDHFFFLATASCRSVFRPALKLSFNSFALCRMCVSQSSKQMSILMPVVSDHQVLDILSIQPLCALLRFPAHQCPCALVQYSILHIPVWTVTSPELSVCTIASPRLCCTATWRAHMSAL